MAELIKEFIKMNQFVKPERLRTVLEYDCIVPDTYPDIMSVLAADGACSVDGEQSENGKIIVNFTTHYKILYLAQGDEPTVKSINTQSSHTVSIDAPGLAESASVFARCCLEHIDFTVVNSRKLSLRSVVKVIADANNTVELGIPVDIHDMDDAQLKKTSYTLSTVSENVDTTLQLVESTELGGGKPAIGCILRSDPSICDITVSKTGGELQIKGNLTVCVLYESDDASRKLEIAESHIPFTHTAACSSDDDTPGLSIRSEIKSFNAEIGEDSDGLPRIIDIKADIKFNITGYSTRTGEMLEDAYSLSKTFEMESDTISAFARTDNISSQFVLKEILAVENGAPTIKEVVNITGQIGQADITVDNDIITVEGYVVCSTLYITGDSAFPLASSHKQIPFTHQIEKRGITAAASVPLQLYVSHTSFSLLSPSEMELRIAIAARGEVIEITPVNVITGIGEITDNSESIACRPSILVYIVQPGDSLWKIAKRYSAQLDALIAINDIKNPDAIMPGDKLLIPTCR